MAITTGSAAGSKVSYVGWKRDTANANNGTIVVGHANDRNNSRICSLYDMSSYNSVGILVTAAEMKVEHTSTTTTTFTNLCGAASIGTVVADGGNTGAATGETEGGTYTGVADGNIVATCSQAGELGVTDINTTAVAGGSNTGSATSPVAAGTYTANVTGTVLLTCTLAGELGTAEFSYSMPDGSSGTGWVSGASGTTKEVAQGVEFGATSGTGDDVDLNDTFTISIYGKAQFTVTLANGTTVADIDTATTTNPTTLGDGVTLTLTSGGSAAGDDLAVGDKYTIPVQAGTKDLKAVVTVVAY